MFARRDLGRAPAPAGARARPLRDQAALLPHGGGELAFASELDALPQRRPRPRRARGLPGDQRRARRRCRSSARSASCRRGTCSIWSEPDAGSALERFARPGPLPVRGADEAELVEECRARLRDSVRAHLVSDVPVGVLLSGGVDSGALTALAAAGELRAAAHVLDRLRGAVLRRAGRRARGRRAATAPVTASSCCAPTPRRSCRRSPPPSTSRSPTPRRCPTYLVSQLAAEDVKVTLSGEGGDELFGGYHTYVADLLAERVGPLAAARCGRAVERLPSSSAPGQPRLPRQALRAGRPPAAARASPRLEGDLLGRCARRAHRSPARVRPLRSWSAARSPRPRATSCSPACRTSTSAATWSTTCWSRPTGPRWPGRWRPACPSSTPSSPNFAFSLPGARTRCAASHKKRLLRRAVEPLLPREVVHGPKRGFSIPAAAWLRGELEPLRARDALPETLRRQGYLEPGGGRRA